MKIGEQVILGVSGGDDYVLFRKGNPEYSETSFEFELKEIVNNEPEPYMEGFIKWDGCANVRYNDEGYLHYCGLEGFERHNALIRKLYQIAKESMNRDDDYLDPVPDYKVEFEIVSRPYFYD